MMSYIFKGFELIGFNETKMNAYSILLFYPYSKNRKMRLYFSTVCNSLTTNPVCFSYHFMQIYLVFFPFQKHIQVDSYLVTLNTLSSLRALRVLIPNDAPSL